HQRRAKDLKIDRERDRSTLIGNGVWLRRGALLLSAGGAVWTGRRLHAAELCRAVHVRSSERFRQPCAARDHAREPPPLSRDIWRYRACGGGAIPPFRGSHNTCRERL